jgi:transposase
VSAVIPPDRHAVLVLDRAPWHRSLNVPENLTLLPLPPYSPELNPQEQIWEFLKNNFLSNRVFENFSAILQACCNAWNALANDPGRIQSIGSRSWNP